MWGLTGVQREAAFAADRVIVAVEELVDESVIRSDPNRITTNPNFKGMANFTFCDGHSKSMKYLQSERCDPTPARSR